MAGIRRGVSQAAVIKVTGAEGARGEVAALKEDRQKITKAIKDAEEERQRIVKALKEMEDTLAAVRKEAKKLSEERKEGDVQWRERTEGYTREAQKIWEQAKRESLNQLKDELRKRERVWLGDMRRRLSNTTTAVKQQDIRAMLDEARKQVRDETMQMVREEIDKRVQCEVSRQQEIKQMVGEAKAAMEAKVALFMPDPRGARVVKEGELIRATGLWLPLAQLEL